MDRFLKEMVNGAGSMIAPLDIGEAYVPIANQPDTITMPGDIWSKLSILFYGSTEDLMRKVFELE